MEAPKCAPIEGFQHCYIDEGNTSAPVRVDHDPMSQDRLQQGSLGELGSVSAWDNMLRLRYHRVVDLTPRRLLLRPEATMSVVPRCDLQVGRGEDVFVAGGRERDFTQVFHGVSQCVLWGMG